MIIFGAVNLLQDQPYMVKGDPVVYPLGFSFLIIPFLVIFGISVSSAGYVCALMGVLTVALLYVCVKELVDEKAAIFASLFLVFSKHWEMSIVVMSDVPALFFMLLSIYAIIKYVKAEKALYFYLFFIAASYAILIRYSSGIVLIIAGLYVLFSRKWYYLKKKELWLGFIVFLIILTPQFIYNQAHFGSWHKTAYSPSLESFFSAGDQVKTGFGLRYLFKPQSLAVKFDYVKQLVLGFGTPVFPFFLLGIWVWIKRRKFDKFALIIPWIIVPYSILFLYYYYDLRYTNIVLLALLIVAGAGFSALYESSLVKKKFIFKVALILLIGLLIVPAAWIRYEKIQQVKSQLKNRNVMLDWLGKNTEKEDVVLSAWRWPDEYYSKRRLIYIPLPHYKLEKILETPSSVYYAVESPIRSEEIKKYNKETLRWLEETYGLTQVIAFEASIEYSYFTRILHDILRHTGLYSAKRQRRWAETKDSWKIFKVQNKSITKK
jgi:4-amino-4-deoxy-L-arabinose transferase-like glycosyltransferase